MILQYSLNKAELVIREIAKKYNLPIPIVENVVKFPYEFTMEQIKEGQTDRPVYHLYLGKFVVKPGRVYHLENNRKNRIERDKAKGDNTGLEEPNMEGSSSREDSQGESS